MSSEALTKRFDVRLAGVLAFGLSYYLLSRLSLSLVAQPEQVAVIWPASGLALGILAISPRRWWPALVGSIFASNLVAQFLARGLHPAGAGLAGVNAIEPVLAAALLLLVVGRRPHSVYGSARGVAGLLAAAVLANAVTSLLAGLVLSVGLGAPLVSAATAWWVADGLGMLAVAPVVFGLIEYRRGAVRVEEMALLLATLLVTLVVFSPASWALPPALHYAYFIYPLLAWTAVRATPRTTSIATLIIALVATIATINHRGPFSRAELTSLESVQALQGFLGVAALLALMLGGVLSERRAFESRLAAGRERFSSVLRATTEFSVIGTDLTGTITVFNEGAERILGYQASEVVDRVTPAIFHDPHEVISRAAELQIAPGFDVFVRALRDNDSETREWTYVRKDGRRLRVSLTVTAMWDESGDLVGYIGIGRDVTQSSRAEAERSALERVSRAVAGAEDLDVILGLVAREAGLLHGATSALITRFDTGDVGTVIGAWTEEGWLSSLRVDLGGETATALVRRTGSVARTHVRGEAGDDRGATAPAAAGLCAGAGAPVIVGGRVWGAISIEAGPADSFADDPSESLGRLAALASLAIGNADYRTALVRRGDELSAIIDGLPGMVWVWSRSGHLMLANRAYNELMAADPITGAPRDEAFGIADGALHLEAMASGQTTYAELNVVGASGEERRLLVARSPLTDRRGEIYALCCVATDITERHEMERAKDEFVSIVSHELRTPLSSIRGALALLVDDEGDLPPGAQRRMIEIALANSKRLVALINDILDIQRIESGTSVLSPQDCDGGELVLEAAEAMGSAALESGVEITVSRREAPLRADPDRILQVLNNLIGNAVKFTPSGGHVSVGTTRVDDEIRFFVRDDGRGIPADKLEKIFGRFEQIDSSDSRHVGGTGLGLAICREIAGQHGGRVWAESELGRGSCFWLALPAATASGGPAEDEGDHQGADRSPPAGTVLICDDDPDARARARAIVEGLGLRALEAASGPAAVRVAAAARPSAILLDVVMPGTDGIETLKALSSGENTSDIPVIVVSALPAEAQETPVPVLDWVIKPFPSERLVQAVSVAMRLAGPARVLVVEDDDGLADVLVEGLRRKGLVALRARTGREGIDLAASALPDLMILDVGLPDGDGFAVVEALRERQIAPAALIVYSAMDLDGHARERMTLGRTEFVTKGRVSPEELHGRIAGLVDRIGTATR